MNLATATTINSLRSQAVTDDARAFILKLYILRLTHVEALTRLVDARGLSHFFRLAPLLHPHPFLAGLSASQEPHSAVGRKLCQPQTMDGWITCDFTSFSTVYKSYQDDEWLIMKGCVQ